MSARRPERAAAMRAWLAGVVALTLLAGCTDAPTEVVVVLEAPAPLAADVTSLALEVEGAQLQHTLSELEGLPALALVRRTSDATQFRVDVDVTLEGGDHVQMARTIAFVAGRRVMAHLSLEESCRGDACTSCDESCRDEASCCAGTLETVGYDPGGVVRDAGGVFDGGGAEPAHCADGVLSGDESDRDCGGSCAPCLVDDDCGVDGDCASGVCGGASARCLAASCRNDERDVNESDTDCGGACDPCAVNLGCGHNGDCVTGVCAAERCRDVTCGNGAVDEGETDVDCGGSCAPCAAGAACDAPGDCESGACRGLGVCRDGCFAAFGGDCDDARLTYLPGPWDGGLFGASLVLAGDPQDGYELFVGAPLAQSTGRVAAYQRATLGEWGEPLTIDAPNDVSAFGAALALAGDELFVGAPTTSSSRGAVIRYVRAAGTWSLAQRLVFDVVDAQAGAALAVEGDWLAVGAPSRDDGVPAQVHLFERATSGDWEWRQTLSSLGPDTSDEDYGNSLAFMDRRLYVGAPGEGRRDPSTDAVDRGAGAVFEYTRSAGSWSLSTFLTSPAGETGAAFGESVAARDGLIVVGEMRGDVERGALELSDSGFGYIFERSASEIVHQATLETSNADTDDYFGDTVAVASSGLFVMSARHEDGAGPGLSGDPSSNLRSDSGAAYVFRELPGLGWRQVLYVKAELARSNDQFGGGLAIDETTLVVSAPWAESAAGGVWIYEFPRATEESCDGFDNDGDGVVDDADEVCPGCTEGRCP